MTWAKPKISAPQFLHRRVKLLLTPRRARISWRIENNETKMADPIKIFENFFERGLFLRNSEIPIIKIKRQREMIKVGIPRKIFEVQSREMSIKIGKMRRGVFLAFFK